MNRQGTHDSTRARSFRLMAACAVPAVICSGFNVQAQPYPAWVEDWTSPGVGEDIGWGIQTDSEGNIIVGGWTEGSDTGLDGVLIKYNRSGKKIWERTYDGPGHGDDHLGEIRIDSNDNIILHGNSLGDGTGQDFLTLKYDSSGTLLWEHRYDGSGNGEDWSSDFKALDIDAQDNVYASGFSWTSNGHYVFTVIKISSAGALEWAQEYASPNPNNLNTYGYVVRVTDNGTVYAAGSASNLNGNGDYALLKYDTNGTLLWDRLYDSPHGLSDAPYSMEINANEDVHLTGIISTGSGYEYGVVKYDSNGNFQWDAQYGGTTGFHYGWAIALDQNDNVYIAGASMTSGGEYDWATVRFDSNGTLVWTRKYRNNFYFGPDWPYNVVVDDNGDIYVCGYVWEWFAEGHNAAVVKYDVNGNVLWDQRYNGVAGGDDAFFQIFIDDADQVLLAGTSLGVGTGTDLILAKYRQGGPATIDVNPMPLVPNQVGTFTVSNVEPGAGTYLVYSTGGEGNVSVGVLNVTLGIKNPKQAGSVVNADAAGTAVWNLPIPGSASGASVWFQGAQYNAVTDIAATSVQ